MEKVLSDNEKIRRAEEIYARRKGIEFDGQSEAERKPNIYRFLFKALLLINIIIVVLCIQNKTIVFNENFLNQFSGYSQIINDKVNAFLNMLKEDEKNIDNIENTTPAESTGLVQNVENTTNFEEKTIQEEQAQELSLEDKIKNSYSFIKPIEGTVTSFFGDRQSKYQNVTGYHTGIDIGAKKGTVIKSSIEGTVSQVSSVGDYRKTFKN